PPHSGRARHRRVRNCGDRCRSRLSPFLRQFLAFSLALFHPSCSLMKRTGASSRRFGVGCPFIVPALHRNTLKMKHKKIAAISLANGLLVVALTSALLGAGAVSSGDGARSMGNLKTGATPPGSPAETVPGSWVNAQQRHEAMASFRNANPGAYFFDVNGEV